MYLFPLQYDISCGGGGGGNIWGWGGQKSFTGLSILNLKIILSPGVIQIFTYIAPVSFQDRS